MLFYVLCHHYKVAQKPELFLTADSFFTQAAAGTNGPGPAAKQAPGKEAAAKEVGLLAQISFDQASANHLPACVCEASPGSRAVLLRS